MKRNLLMAAILTSLFCVNTVFSADAPDSSQLNMTILRVQQNIQAMQAAESNPAAESGEIINLTGTWNGTAPGMNPSGDCITSPVTLIITKQCRNFAKGSITVLGVTVPVMGTFKNNHLSLNGFKAGAPAWIAGIGAQYVSGKFMVGSFSFVKNNIQLNNRYDSNWLLN